MQFLNNHDTLKTPIYHVSMSVVKIKPKICQNMRLFSTGKPNFDKMYYSSWRNKQCFHECLAIMYNKMPNLAQSDAKFLNTKLLTRTN
jgi:hypothetical protein